MRKSLGKIPYLVAYDKIQIEGRSGTFYSDRGNHVGLYAADDYFASETTRSNRAVGRNWDRANNDCVYSFVLTIHGGWLYKRKKIPGAPAPSLDRLEIFFRSDSVVISPKDKPGFIAELTRLNPEIEVV